MTRRGRSKYGAKACYGCPECGRACLDVADRCCGSLAVRFDSRGERTRYARLCVLRGLGEISDLRRQVRFPLAAKGGKPVGAYVADFTYIEGGKRVIEDFKGHDTQLSAWKRRHVRAEYGVEVLISKV